MVNTLKKIFTEANSLNDYLSSRGINPKFVSRETKISHAKSAQFQKWKNDRKMAEETIVEASESELLAKYLNSRGINPKFATKEQKIAHSKSGQFQKWKRDHQHLELGEAITSKHTPTELRVHALKKAEHMHKEIKSDGIHKELHKEEVDKEDTITFDIPLLIRVLEYAREDSKTDMDLHKVTEKLISIRDKGTLTMADYDFIVKLKEEYMTEGRMKDIATDREETARLKKMSALDKFRADATAREKKHDEISKKSGGMTAAIDRLEKHLKSENTLDSMAATEAPCDCANGGETTSNKKKEMSKSARIIKSIYKKLNMKEETYDWEKDDKTQDKSYGKSPKINTLDKKGTLGDTKPEARAVMKGGTTLTGQPRDMVEIDPDLKQRPGDKGQTTFPGAIAKKSPNFN